MNLNFSRVASFCCAAFISLSAVAQLTYDTTFATNGKYISGASGDANAKAMALHQGKTYVAGVCPSVARPPAAPAKPVCVLRLLTNGQPDPTFNAGNVANVSGRVSHIVGDTDADVSAIAVSTTGIVTVSGRCTNSISSVCLLRLQPNGAPVAGVGANGRMFFVVTFTGDNTLLALDDASVLFAMPQAAQTIPTTVKAMIRRIDVSGVVSTWGEASLSGYGNAYFTPRALTLLNDGKIALAGQCSQILTPAQTSFCVARFLATGALDPTFGSAVPVPTPGVFWLNTTPVSTVYAAVSRSATGFAVFGRCFDGNYKVCAVAFHDDLLANGSAGVLEWSRPNFPDMAYSADIPVRAASFPDGRFVVATAATGCVPPGVVGCPSQGPGVIVLRFDATGAYDSTMDTGIFTTALTDVVPTLALAGIAVQADRKLVIAGDSAVASPDFFVGRLNNIGATYKACSADIDGDGAHTPPLTDCFGAARCSG